MRNIRLNTDYSGVNKNLNNQRVHDIKRIKFCNRRFIPVHHKHYILFNEK